MIKKVALICFCLFGFMFTVDNTYAANICNGSKYNELIREVNKIELKWKLKFDEKNNHYFEVTVANMSDRLLLSFNDLIYEVNSDGSPFIIKTFLQGGNSYEFKFYGGYNDPCVEEYISTKTLEIPKYNGYSELPECIEYEEFALCNKWYEGNIPSDEYFYEQLEIYKQSLVVPEEFEPVEEEKNLFDKFIDFYIENIIFTLPITVVVVILIVIIIVIGIKKSRNRVKINLEV